MKRLLVIAVLACAMASALVSPIFGTETLTCTDKMGRTITLSVPVKRAAVFQTNELIPALGIWDRVVALSKQAYESDLMMATRPDLTTAITCASSGGDVNIEALLRLKPDVVITWASKPDTVTFMEKHGLKVISVFPDNFAELFELMHLYGRLFGKQDRVKTCIAEMDKVLDIVKEGVARVEPDRRKKVLWLSGKPTTVACGVGVTSELIRLLGGINPAADINLSSADVSMEQIVSWNPDVIFVWGYAGYSTRTILDSGPWKFVNAVREGQVYKAPRWSNWSPRVAPVLLWMAMKTYPEQFQKVDLQKVCDNFFRELYGIPYDKVGGIER